MSTPVSIILRAEGVAEVHSAIRGIRQAWVEMEQEATAAALRESKKRIDIYKAELDAERNARRDSRRRRDHDDLDRAFGRSGPSARSAITGTNTGSTVLDSFMKGEGLAGVAKAAGVAGVAIASLSKAIDLAAAALKQFASFVLSDVIKPSLELETAAVQMANNSGGKLTAKEIENSVRATSIRSNMDPMAILKAAGDFQDLTGDPKLSLGIMNSVATIAKGRGFELPVMTNMLGTLWKPGMQQGELENLMLTLIAQGEKEGSSITFGKLAGLGGRFTAPTQSFAGDYGTRIAMAGALLQTTKPKMGSEAYAATGLARFTSESLQFAKAFAPDSIMKDESGVEKIVDPAKLIADIYRKTSGNVGALKDIGYKNVISRNFIGSYKETFDAAFDKARASGKSEKDSREEAAQAVEQFIKGFVTANTTMADEEKKRNAVLQTSGEKWETAMNQIKEKLLEIMPTVQGFIDDFAKAAPDIADAALTLANALLWVADIIRSILKPFASSDDDPVEPGRRGKYELNPESGQLEFVAASQLRKTDDVLNPLGLTKDEQRNLGARLALPKSESKPSEPSPQPPDLGTVGGPLRLNLEKVDVNADKTADKLDRLNKSLDDFHSQINAINRSEPFTKR
ncbi:hypothetical protein WMF27_20505 [Sorangium sp. So ce281]|uniref:hypothetical protein n=1 Tax=unclassified Sorangium TaxID=2621164 RepID=UPI003F626F67